MTDVSLIIAAYNSETTIGPAIRSALAQQGVDLEIIVVDDASSDRTAEIAGAITDKRCRVIHLTKNAGPAGARNAGFRAASGAWIAVLDADDTMDPTRLRDLVTTARRYDLDIVADNMRILRDGRDCGPFIQESLDGTLQNVTLARFFEANLLFGTDPSYGYLKPVFRAEMLRGFGIAYDETLRIGEDCMLVAEALVRGARYGRRRVAQYRYRVAAGSISHRLLLEDASAMLEADHRFLARHEANLSPTARSAVRAHRRSLQEAVTFIGMVESVKQARFGALVRSAIFSPATLRHFQMPISARLRRVRGGRAARA